MEIRDSIANEFNEFSKNYTNDMVRCVPHYLKLISAFTDHLPQDFVPNRILDLGCGNGNVTSRLLQLFPDSHFTLLDASREMINICKDQFNTYNVEYIESYFKDYKFKNEYFDLITAGFSLHHCNSQEKKLLFHRIYGSLRKGGIFACSDLMINKNKPEHVILLNNWKTFVYESFPEDEKWEWLMEHYGEFDKPDDYNDQLEWLQEAGFKKIMLPINKSYWAHFQALKS
jgi:ubiquinone/menaquinone biosynthesis C-methylase UbiE